MSGVAEEDEDVQTETVVVAALEEQTHSRDMFRDPQPKLTLRVVFRP
jgi:hypothetical protein